MHLGSAEFSSWQHDEPNQAERNISFDRWAGGQPGGELVWANERHDEPSEAWVIAIGLSAYPKAATQPIRVEREFKVFEFLSKYCYEIEKIDEFTKYRRAPHPNCEVMCWHGPTSALENVLSKVLGFAHIATTGVNAKANSQEGYRLQIGIDVRREEVKYASGEVFLNPSGAVETATRIIGPPRPLGSPTESIPRPHTCEFSHNTVLFSPKAMQLVHGRATLGASQ